MLSPPDTLSSHSFGDLLKTRLDELRADLLAAHQRSTIKQSDHHAVKEVSIETRPSEESELPASLPSPSPSAIVSAALLTLADDSTAGDAKVDSREAWIEVSEDVSTPKTGKPQSANGHAAPLALCEHNSQCSHHSKQHVNAPSGSAVVREDVTEEKTVPAGIVAPINSNGHIGDHAVSKEGFTLKLGDTDTLIGQPSSAASKPTTPARGLQPPVLERVTSLIAPCSMCGSMMRHEEVYCRDCGAARKQARKCICGNNLMHDALFCRRCGVPVGSAEESVQCANCKNVMVHDAKFCRMCGHKKGCPVDSERLDRGMFVLHHVWESSTSTRLNHVAVLQSMAINDIKQRFLASSAGTGPARFEEFWSKVVMTPFALKRLVWDSLQMIVLVSEAVLLPMQFLDLGQSTFIVFMRWFIRLYWTFDMPLSFVTGYYRENGLLEMRPHAVATHFAKTWFPFDLSMVSVDWISYAASGDDDQGHVTVVVSALRMARLMRILRLMKLLPDVLRSIGYMWRDNSIPLLIGVFQIMCIMVYINHFVACIWYGLGNSGTSGNTWLRASGVSDSKDSTAYGYVIAWHWSLTQFIGSTDINPMNASERVYAVSVLCVAFMVMCVLPARITSLMTQLNLITADQSAQLSHLNEFLYDQGVTRRLALEVQRNARRALKKGGTRHEKDVQVLALISEPLLVEMHYEMYAEHLMKHPLMRKLDADYHMAFQQICHKAVSQTHLSEDDLVFCTGEFPDKPVMYFVLEGELAYKEFGKELPEDISTVGPKQWVSEGTLWTPWVHRGLAWAKTPCTLLMLRAHTFQDILTKFMTPRAEPRRYGELFVQRLNDMPFNEITDVCAFDIGDMVSAAFRVDGGTQQIAWR